MSTTTSPTRRVLGEKDPNANLQIHSLSPRKANVHTGLENASPIAQRPTTLKRALSPSSPRPRAGQKRKIEDANDEESIIPDSQDGNASTAYPHAHPLSQMTDILSDSPSEVEGVGLYKSTPNTVFSSFRPSQDDPSHVQVEAQFEIHEEPSQQTLDKMHAVTLPQNTSQIVPPLRPNLNKECSQISLSMSSLIDFGNNRSSQVDETEDQDPAQDDMQMMEEDQATEVPKEQIPKTQEEARKEMLLEKAATLRTRLQLALFKIQTNQISRPFAHLQLPKTDRLSSSPPDITVAEASSSSPSSSSTIRDGGGRGSYQSPLTPESRIALARARATMDPKLRNTTVKSLSSLPMPHIAPTAFSARWNTVDEAGPPTGTSDHQQHQQQQQQQPQPGQNQIQSRSNPTHSNIEIPSSPPLLPVAQGSEGNGKNLHDQRILGGQQSHRQQQHMLSMSDEQPRTPLRRVSYPYPDSAPSSISVDRRQHHHHHSYQEGEIREHDVQAPHTGHQQRGRGYRPGGLTSSVVKGEAANSLLELVRGGNGNGNGNGNGHDGYSGYGTATSGGVGMCGL
ncbi:hypothetical protein ABEF95_008457 [Exophiala dermatitidis]